MKRLFLSLLLPIMAVSAWCDEGTTFTAKTIEGVELCYTVVSEDEKTCVVLGATTESETVTIPNTANGYTVVAITEGAFNQYTCMKEVTIPGTVWGIGSAFQDCTGLKEVVFPEGLEYIDSDAFSGCRALKTVTFPSSLKTIHTSFKRCGLRKVIIPDIANWCAIERSTVEWGDTARHLYSDAETEIRELKIPVGVKRIADNAFAGFKTITSVKIPEGVETIGRSAFYNCWQLEGISIPSSLKTIGDNAFSRSTITELQLPEGVENLGYKAFYDCYELATVSFPSSLKTMSYSSFESCNKLQKFIIPDIAGWCKLLVDDGNGGQGAYPNVNRMEQDIHLYSDANTEVFKLEIPEGVTMIPSTAFENFKSLTSVKLPEGVASINEASFAYCTGLNTLYIPKSLQEIGKEAFYRCENLQKIIIADIGSWCEMTISGSDSNPLAVTEKGSLYSDENTEITDLIIPEGTRFVRPNAFSDCMNITSIVIPSSVKDLGDYAFKNCMGLQSITSNINIPFKLDSTAFGNSAEYMDNILYSIVPLYVPKGRANLYKNTEGWKLFATIEEGEPEGSDATLTVKQADNGTVGIQVAKGKTCTLNIKAEQGWKVHSVTFNGQEVTAQLGGDGLFTTPTITGDATLNVVYEKEGDAVSNPSASSVRIQGTAFGVRVTGVAAGETIQVFTEDSIMQKSVPMTGFQTDIPLKADQLYLIKVAGKVLKLRH